MRILIADNHAVIRDGLRTIIEARGDMEVVGEAVNGRYAIDLAEQLKPDVIVMDIAMPEVNGINATRYICGQWPSIKVVMFSMFSSSEHVFQAMQAGAKGYVLKESTGECIVNAIKTVMRNMVYFGEGVDDPQISSSKRKGVEKRPFDRLSTREKETLQLVAEGNTNAVIAEKLGVAVPSVEVYRTRFMQKLGIGTIPALVLVALEYGVISRPEDSDRCRLLQIKTIDEQSLDKLKSLTVLYVEDDDDTRELYSQFLSRTVGVLITAKDGAEGLAAYHLHHPDIIITDINMPVMDGLEMLKQVHTLDASIPAIVLSAFDITDEQRQSGDLGYLRHEMKPVSGTRLQVTLLECADGLRGERLLNAFNQDNNLLSLRW